MAVSLVPGGPARPVLHLLGYVQQGSLHVLWSPSRETSVGLTCCLSGVSQRHSSLVECVSSQSP